MPRYYFHVRRGQMTVLDQQGIELVGTVNAEIEAAQRANGEFLKGQSASPARIIVADDNWQTLFELPF